MGSLPARRIVRDAMVGGCGYLAKARYRYASIAPTAGCGEGGGLVGALLARRSIRGANVR